MAYVSYENNTKYTVYVISGSRTYNITPALVSLERSELEGQIAQRVVMQLRNVDVIDGPISTSGLKIYDIMKAVIRVYVYANDGKKEEEVFRGFLWNMNTKTTSTDLTKLKYTAYDHLIYLQKSEGSFYFSSSKKTKQVISTICKDWGVKLSYNYKEITHQKMPLRGNLYDILTTDILDKVKRNTGKKYVILSDKDTMYVKLYGTNKDVYCLNSGQDITGTSHGWTMEDVVTKVIILGQAAEGQDYEPIVATVTGNTKKYGTLQKVVSVDDDTPLNNKKVEAQNIIAEDGEPKWEWEITAADIPWIRKGDKVSVYADHIDKKLFVKSVTRTLTKKKCEMRLTLEESAVSDVQPEPWNT